MLLSFFLPQEQDDENDKLQSRGVFGCSTASAIGEFHPLVAVHVEQHLPPAREMFQSNAATNVSRFS